MARLKAWYELTQEELEKFGRRQAVAAGICIACFLAIFVWKQVGWRFRFIELDKTIYSDQETGASYTDRTYYDLSGRVLFHAVTGREVMLSFGDDDEDTGPSWPLYHTVRQTDYARRYWYEHAGELRALLTGLPYDLKLDNDTRLFVSLDVYLPGDEGQANELKAGIQDWIGLHGIRIEHFWGYKHENGVPAMILHYLDIDKANVMIRLASGF